jgi:hypothetical protein
MDRVTEIVKAAFIARVNQAARAIVVDTYYKTVTGGGCILMLVYSDGTESQFRGLRAA